MEWPLTWLQRCHHRFHRARFRLQVRLDHRRNTSQLITTANNIKAVHIWLALPITTTSTVPVARCQVAPFTSCLKRWPSLRWKTTTIFGPKMAITCLDDDATLRCNIYFVTKLPLGQWFHVLNCFSRVHVNITANENMTVSFWAK